MKVESRPETSHYVPAGIGCSLCEGSLARTEVLVVQWYPGDDWPGSAVVGDDFLAVCPDCAVEVDELVESWTAHGEPPVAAEWSIHDGYRQIADECGFCDCSLDDGPTLGVEYYRCRDGSDGVGPYANYSLCASCVTVFDEFLAGVRAGARST